MPNWVLATGNPGKLKELQALLADLRVIIKPQSEFAVPEAEETATTFVENALIKARNAALHTGFPAIADDSGIEVDALAGAPGVYSARYAGSPGSDRANVDKLLAALAAVPEHGRGARFQCVLVYMRHAADPTPLICQAAWEGRIARAPRGEHGFGYDPVFYLADFGKTAAELDPAVKNRLSHRAQALQKLRAALIPLLSGDHHD
ncbi:MAG: RdgB/HAM1 family non-canonical purine NTP pyrophosphatase [Gammaproteobacteria bacterium]